MRPGSITDSVFQVTTKVPTCWAFEEDDGTTTRDTGPEVTIGSSRGKSKIGFSPGPWGDLSDLRASHLRSCTHRDTSQAAVFSPRCGLRFTGICLLIFWILPDRKETWTFIGRPLVLEQLPGLPRQVRRKSGGLYLLSAG